MEKVRIQDDLYHYVNQEWLETAVIPDDKPTTGGFADLAKGVEELLINDFNKMSKEESFPSENLKKAVKLYGLVKNVKKRNKDGIKPALKTLAKIEKLNNVAALNRNLDKFILEGISLPVQVFVEADMKDTNKRCLMVQGPTCILPDTVYYKEEMKAQHDQIIGIWSQMVSTLLTYTKLSEEDQKTYLEDAIKFDALVATLVKSSEEWSEYTKMYNPMKASRVNSMVKPLKLNKALEKILGFVPEEIVVTEPRFFKGFKTVFNEDTFILYKHWAYIKELIGSCPLLSEELREIGGLYQRALTGVAAVTPVEKHAFQLASSFFSQPIGLYYGETYFGEEAKKDIVEMVNEIIETYKNRVKNNDILEDQTKEKAIKKLSTMKVKMGYPDSCEEIYDKFEVTADKSLYENVCEIIKKMTENNFSKLTKPVDKTLWGMPGHMVNASYNPTSNDITFPAAILQPPFYSIKQTRSENLGGIGAVIGHEISHAFDNNGAKCDENGNLNNWWTKADLKKFNARTKAMIKEFEGIELPWGKVNATFIVSENIADNGGMASTLDIMKTMKDANYEEYFMNWARVWCMKAKEDYLKLLLNVDVHAPAILRANMQPRNFDEWYTTFNVKKTDKMYIAPSKRVIIW